MPHPLPQELNANYQKTMKSTRSNLRTIKGKLRNFKRKLAKVFHLKKLSYERLPCDELELALMPSLVLSESPSCESTVIGDPITVIPYSTAVSSCDTVGGEQEEEEEEDVGYAPAEAPQPKSPILSDKFTSSPLEQIVQQVIIRANSETDKQFSNCKLVIAIVGDTSAVPGAPVMELDAREGIVLSDLFQAAVEAIALLKPPKPLTPVASPCDSAQWCYPVSAFLNESMRRIVSGDLFLEALSSSNGFRDIVSHKDDYRWLRKAKHFHDYKAKMQIRRRPLPGLATLN